jgi:filamentous hemagglutinin family protein
VSIPGISFWHQDVNWYIQQQSWTKSFHQADQNWTAELSGSGSPGSAGSASIIDQKIVNLVTSQSESSLTGALQASGATSGSLLNLFT